MATLRAPYQILDGCRNPRPPSSRPRNAPQESVRASRHSRERHRIRTGAQHLSSPCAYGVGSSFHVRRSQLKRGGSVVDFVYILILVALYGLSHWIVRAISRLEGK